MRGVAGHHFRTPFDFGRVLGRLDIFQFTDAEAETIVEGLLYYPRSVSQISAKEIFKTVETVGRGVSGNPLVDKRAQRCKKIYLGYYCRISRLIDFLRPADYEWNTCSTLKSAIFTAT